MEGEGVEEGCVVGDGMWCAVGMRGGDKGGGWGWVGKLLGVDNGNVAFEAGSGGVDGTALWRWALVENNG